MLYVLLVAAIVITIKMVFQVAVAKRQDQVMQQKFTVYCEDAVVTKIDTIKNEASGHTDTVLYLDFSIEQEVGGEVVKKHGRTRWFVTPDKGGYGHKVGDIFPIMISPIENNAVSLERWESLLKECVQYRIAMYFGICTIAVIVVQIIRSWIA